MVLRMRRRKHSPLVYLVGLIAILMVVRWAGFGDAHVLAVVNLILLSVMLAWGSLITRRQRQR